MRRHARAARTVAASGIQVAAITAALVSLARLSRVSLTWWGVALAAAIVIGSLRVQSLLGSVEAPPGTARASGDAIPGPPGLASANQQVLTGLRSADLYRRTLQPALRSVAAQRLLRRFGVDLGTDPDRARALLGPAAARLVLDRVEPPSPEEIESVLCKIGNL